MQRLTSNDVLVSVPPFQAYADDVARLGGTAPLGAGDDAWLLLAQLLTRAASLPPDARAAVLGHGGAALRVAGHAAVGDALVALAEAGDGDALAAAAQAACTAVQEFVAGEERGGAFRLAFTTLAAAHVVLGPLVDARGTGLLLAQQGRTARQLGAMQTARTLYLGAASAGRRGRAADVLARAMMGLGALANMRGNYPAARAAYQRALTHAMRAQATDYVRAAHHGLLGVATVAGDVDGALTHGWHAFAGTPDEDHDARAEMLVNLAEISRKADQHRAALGACLQAIELSSNPRLCLPALGTAAMAAAVLGERVLLDELVERAERIIAVSSQPYENAFTLVELADACATAGLGRGVALARRAGEVAEAWSFFEIVHRAHEVVARFDARQAVAEHQRTPITAAGPSRRWTPQAQRAIRALESLVPAHARAVG